MSRVIAVVNQKGGVAKTPTVANLGVALAQAGKRCLLVDSDPQGSLTISPGQDPDALAGRTLYEAMVLAEEETHKDFKDVALCDQQGVDLIPANLDLAAAEIDLNSPYAREYTLSRLLVSVRDAYDFILMDCPPQLGILTINALVAADSVLVPLATNYLSLRGLQLLLQTVRMVQSRLNSGYTLKKALIEGQSAGSQPHSEGADVAAHRFNPFQVTEGLRYLVLALTGFVTSTNFRAIGYTTNRSQTSSRDQPEGLGFAD